MKRKKVEERISKPAKVPLTAHADETEPKCKRCDNNNAAWSAFGNSWQAHKAVCFSFRCRSNTAFSRTHYNLLLFSLYRYYIRVLVKDQI